MELPVNEDIRTTAARKGEPYGNSPHGGNYGPIPWDEAMRLPGSTQVGLAGKLLQSLPSEKFQPHNDWAEWQTPSPEKFLVPYVAGIPRTLRVIYVPTAQPIRLLHLESDVHYSARIFDPLTGKTTDLLTDARAGESWSLSPPSGWGHDWVVLLDSPTR